MGKGSEKIHAKKNTIRVLELNSAYKVLNSNCFKV